MDEQLHDIEGVEIFAVGTWNGDSYTDADLNNIVSSYEETKGALKPYLKLGHGEKQELLANDELPAAGFVKRVYRNGAKILADFTRVPKKIYELLKKKAYNRVSVELYKDIKIGEKMHDWALKAVALLGGETPAVQCLDDILNLYSNASKPETPVMFDTDAQVRRVDFNLLVEKSQEDKTMEAVEKLTKENEDLKAKLVSLTEENRVLKENQSKIEKSVEEIRAYAEEQKAKNDKLVEEKKLSEINAKVEKLVTDKKITPARAEKLKSILKGLPTEAKFKFGDKEYDSVGALVFEFASEGDVVLNGGNKSELGQEKSGDELLDEKAKEYQAKHKVSYKDAVIAVAVESK